MNPNIQTISCGKCNAKIKFDSQKLNPQKPLIRCPVCQTINMVSQLQKQLDVTQPVLQEKTQVHQQPIMPVLPKNNQITGKHSDEMGWLIVHDEVTPEQTLPIKMGKNIIGRASESKPADVPIRTQDSYMSRNHCVIEVIRQPNGKIEYLLYDIGSTNGTFINGDKKSRLRPNMQVLLRDGDTLQIGRTKVVFKTVQQSINEAQARQTVLLSPYTPTIIM